MIDKSHEPWNYALIVTPGLEETALAEFRYWSPILARVLGVAPVLPLSLIVADHGVLEFQAPLLFGLALNHVLKVPTRILLRITSFRCRDFPKLFNKIRKLDWQQYTGPDNISWEVSATRSRVAVERRIESTCQDGVAAYFKQLKKAKTQVKNIPQSIYIRIADDQCTVSIDTSGGFLFKRGIRIRVEEAPLRETLAAALIWSVVDQTGLQETNASVALWDAMTGTGCIPLEAAGLLLPNDWVDYPYSSWLIYLQTLRHASIHNHDAFIEKIKGTSGESWFSQVTGSDISGKAIASAEANLENFAKLHHGRPSAPVTFFEMDLLNAALDAPIGNPDWCIINPPYNERLSTGSNPVDFYQRSLTEIIRVSSVKLIGIIVPTAHAQQILAPAGFTRKRGSKFKNGGLAVEFVIFTRLAAP